MADIFDEVEEDLRRARFEEFWKKYWPLMAALAAVVILAIGGWRFYDWRQEQQSAAAGGRFEAAMRLSRTNAAEAEAQFAAIAADAPTGYRILARFRQATELAGRDKEAAVKAFDAIAADSAIGPVLQDVARIRAGYLLVDTATPAEIARRVEPLAAPGLPFRHSARELLALAAMRAGDKAAADKWLQAIQADQETPQGVRGRAELIAAVMAGLAK
ncbi:tetratricopeptide repeat protein [Phreatobacter stygius]|uniref:Tetratricopeptide repeat protein n=1 Tax=Phreatobacter stygius TaxID=1940610 RepID=A0A4D7BBG7_9HYPH|nr:tetratricopeptide repeat protein [Phreatobacter stygius]QCI68040.1 tetratricopeptide repeat protein [Phreatobacter stygius]